MIDHISLTWAEIAQAGMAGVIRRIAHLKSGNGDKRGTVPNPWQSDIESCLAELAVAKAKGVYWTGNTHSRAKADAGDLQVRQTGWNDGCLLIYSDDNESQKYVLAIGAGGSYRFAGWAYGSEGKQDKYLDTERCHEPTYMVPQRDLHPISEL